MGIWLIFFMVCFAGIGFMFFCMLRRQDALLKAMREEHAQFRVLLRALGNRLEPREDNDLDLDASHDQAPLSVDEALSAYARKERTERGERPGRESGLKGGLPDMGMTAKGGLPDLKF